MIKEETRVSEIKRGHIGQDVTKFSTEEVNIIFGIIGEIQGLVIFSSSMKTAINVVNRMIEENFQEFNNTVADGIAEMGNVITGRATILLEKNGFHCDLSPPTLISGVGAKVSTYSLTMINVPLITDLGTINVKIGLKKANPKS